MQEIQLSRVLCRRRSSCVKQTLLTMMSERGYLNYKDLQFAPNTQVLQVQDYVSKYYNISEANLMSKTFAKLREVTIGYNLPAKC